MFVKIINDEPLTLDRLKEITKFINTIDRCYWETLESVSVEVTKNKTIIFIQNNEGEE